MFSMEISFHPKKESNIIVSIEQIACELAQNQCALYLKRIPLFSYNAKTDCNDILI